MREREREKERERQTQRQRQRQRQRERERERELLFVELSMLGQKLIGSFDGRHFSVHFMCGWILCKRHRFI